MITLELSALQVRDLVKLVVAQQKRVKEDGDRPYWRGIQSILDQALKENNDKIVAMVRATIRS